MAICLMCGEEKRDIITDETNENVICVDCAKICSKIMNDESVKDEKVIDLAEYKRTR